MNDDLPKNDDLAGNDDLPKNDDLAGNDDLTKNDDLAGNDERPGNDEHPDRSMAESLRAADLDQSAPAWRGCLRATGMVLLLVGVLGLLGLAALYISIQQSFRAPEAVPVSLSWTSREAVLTRDRPTVRGRLTMTSTQAPASTLLVGLNAGLPATTIPVVPPGNGESRPSGDGDPAALLSGSAVRLGATQGVGVPPSTCLAPCELRLPLLSCAAGACSATVEFTVELMAGADASPTQVSVEIAGGATASLKSALPPGFTVDMVLDLAPGGG